MKFAPHFLSPLLLALLGVVSTTQLGAAGIWTGGGADSSFATAGNWDTGVPANNGTVNISFAGTTRLDPTASVNWDLLGLTFANTAGAFVLGGNQLTLRGGGIVNNAANLQTINNSLVLGAAQTWSALSGGLQFGGSIANGGFLLTVAGSFANTLDGILSGTGGLTKSGTGTLTLSGANTYTGITTLSAGVISIGSNTAFGTSAVTFVTTTLNTNGGARTLANSVTLGGTTTITAANDLTFNGAVSLTGSRTVSVTGAGVVSLNGVVSQSSSTARKLTKSGAGTLILGNANTYTGGMTLSTGTLILGNGAAVGTGLVSLGTATLQATGTAGTLTNLVTLAGNTIFAGANDFTFTNTATLSSNRTLTINNSAVTFSGLLNQSTTTARSLTKAGLGTLILSGSVANAYTGSTIVNDGTLVLAKTAGVNAFGGTVLTIGDSTGAVNSAVVRLNAADQIPNATAVTIKLDGQLNLQSFTDAIGSLTTTGGSVIGTGRLDLGGNVTAAATGTNVTTISAPLGLNATRTFLINNNSVTTDADFTVSGVISDGSAASGLIKTGVGTLLLTGANTYSGTTEVNAGIVWIDGSSTSASGPLGVGSVNLGDVTGTSTATLLLNTTSGRTVANAISTRAGGTGLLTLGGLNTSGVNTFSGAITLNRNLTLTAATGGQVDLTGVISGTGFGLTKSGAGIVKLTAANTFTGLTTVSAGTLLYGADDALGGGSVTVSAGTLDLGADHSDTVGTVILSSGGSILGTGSSTLNSTANFDLRSGTVMARLGGSVDLVKTTSGTVTLSGANAYTGATTISAGTLRLAAANAVPLASAVSVAGGATFDLAGYDHAIGSLSGGGSVLLGSAMLTAGGDNSSTTFSGVLSGTGGLTKTGSGVLTLSGANTYTGATTISAGTLQLGAANVIADASPVSVSISAGATFDLNGFSETVGSLAGAGSVALGGGTLTAGGDLSSTTFAGQIGGAGGLIKIGTGSMTLTGVNNLTGAITVNAGTLALSGTSGSAAAATALTISDGTTLVLDNSAGENLDRLADTASISLAGGTLRFVSDANGSTETLGALNASSGASTITIVHNGGAADSTSLTFSALGTIASGASVNFNAIGSMLGAGATGAHIWILGQEDGFIGGWATVGSDFAEYYADGVRAFSSYYAGSDGINVDDAKIVQLDASSLASAFTLTNAGTTTDLGLNIGALAAVDLGADNTQTLNLASGGLIKSGATATTIFGAGRLTAGGTASGSLSISVDAGHSLAISASIIDNAGANGIYGDGDDGIVSLTKADAGVLILRGANTYSGSNFLNGGTVEIASESNLGAAGNDVAFGGGTLHLTSGFAANAGKVFHILSDLAGTLDIDAGQTLTLGNASDVLGTGNTASTLFKSGAGSLVIQSANAGFDGVLKIVAGTVELRNAQALGDAVNRGRIVLSGGALRLRNDASTSFANDVSLTANATIDVDRLTGAGAAVEHTLGALSIGAQTLTITGSNGAALALGSVALSGNATFNPTTANASVGAISGAFGISKTGTGVLSLSGVGSYTGGTTIAAGTLRLAVANGVPATSAVNVAGGAVFDLNGYNNAVGSITGSGGIQLGAGTLSTGGDHTSTTFSGVIGGAGGLTKIGNGVLTLSGANTFTGATTISAGTLRLGAANVIADASALNVAAVATFDLNNFSETIGSLAGSGNVALGSGTLTAGADQSSTAFSGAISGTGGFTKSGAGTLTLSGASGFSGVLTVGAGTLALQNAAALGSSAGGTVVGSGGTLQLAANVDVSGEALALSGSGTGGAGALRGAGGSSWAGAITLASDAAIGSDSGLLSIDGAVALGANTLTFTGAGSTETTGAIGGGGGLIKTGSGTLTLTGASTFTGTTAINAGILQLQHAAALGATGAASGTIVASGATLQLNSPSDLSVNAKTLTLNGSGVGGIGAFDSVAGDNEWKGGVILASNSTIGVDADSLTISGTLGETGGAHSLTKIGAGTLLIAGSSTFTGVTQITAGTLQIAAANRLSDSSAVIISAGATLSLDDNAETIGSLAGAGAVDLGTSASAVLATGGNGASTTFSGAIGGSGDLVKQGSGTLILSGTNTFTGTTTINGGAVAITGTASLGNAANTVAVNAGALEATTTFTTTRAITLGNAASAIMVDPTQTFTVNSAITGSGALNKIGSGTLALGAANTFTGGTFITAGTLNLTGSLAGGVTLGNSGTLMGTGTVNGTVNNAGTVSVNGGTFTLAGVTSHFNNTGAVSVINGTLRVGGNYIQTAGSTLLKNGTITAASIQFLGGTIVDPGTSTLNGNVSNTSSFRVDGGSTLNVNGSFANTSAGSVNIVENSTLNVTTGYSMTNAGALTIEAGSTIALATGSYSQSAGSTTINGALATTALAISGGAVSANTAGALGSTNSISLTGGTLLLGGTGDRIKNTATVLLAGGTFATGGLSETVGALTLSGDSTIDFGFGTSLLTFASETRTGGLLTITNWDGSTAGGGADQLRSIAAVDNSVLAAIRFEGRAPGAAAIQFGGYYEIVPVPEPSTIFAALALVGGVAFRERKRLRGLAAFVTR